MNTDLYIVNLIHLIGGHIMTLEELVNKNLTKLNPTDLIVWRYIYAHKKECCYISIYDIATACNVSRTTVLRFAKKLSLDGFSDLKMMLKMELGQVREKPSMDIAQATINLCQKVGDEIAKQDFTKVNKLLYNAKRVFIYSSGFVQRNVANEIIRLFINCNILVYEIRGSDEFKTALKKVTPEDLFIIISLSGESTKVVEFGRMLRSYRIPIISMTRLKSNTLSSISTENIYVTPIELPANLDIKYESLLGFFLAVEIWFVSYSQYCAEQVEELK